MPDIVFQTEFLRYTISSTGWNQGVQDLGGGAEYCRRPGHYPFVSFGGGTAGRPRRVVRKGSRLHVTFEQRGAEAVLEVVERPHYVTFELKELRGIAEPVFELASLGVSITDHVGKWLNTCWNRSFGLCMLALDLRTQSFCDTMHEPAVIRPVMTIRSHAAFGHVGAKYAMIGAPRCELENVIAEVARDYGLPAPTDEHGVPMKKSYRAQRSYLFLMHMGREHEALSLDLARKGGFGLIMSDNYWTYSSYGSYRFRKDRWPGGEKQYIAWTDRVHKAGLGVGLHCMSSCVAEHDPLVIEGTRGGFVPDGGNILAADVSAKAGELPVLLPAYGALAGGIFRVGEELIRVGDSISMSQVAAVPPPATAGTARAYVLAPVVRGIAGTRPAAHKKGTPLTHFRTVYGFCPDLDGPVAAKVGARLAEIANRCRMDMMYFDGLEGVHGLQWYNGPKFMLDVFNRLDHQNVVLHASDAQHFAWHLYTRFTSGDTAVCFDETPVEHLRAKEQVWMQDRIDNLLMPAYDWHGWNFRDSDTPMGVVLKPTEATTLRDWALYLESARRMDVPLGVLAGVPDFRRNPDSQKMLAMTRQYESERIKRLYGEKI